LPRWLPHFHLCSNNTVPNEPSKAANGSGTPTKRQHCGAGVGIERVAGIGFGSADDGYFRIYAFK
jgi:hypothetical protein